MAPRLTMNGEIVRMMKFGAVGVANTLVTFAVFVALRAVSCPLDAANFAGYAAGICNAFVWQRLWVFRARTAGWQRQAASFLLGAAVCWAVQWVAFRLLVPRVGELAAQLLGMVVYTALNYVYNRRVTFGARPHEKQL